MLLKNRNGRWLPFLFCGGDDILKIFNNSFAVYGKMYFICRGGTEKPWCVEKREYRLKLK